MRSIELFSGCGGLAYGLSRAGFGHELLVEWNADAVETILHNQRRSLVHVQHWPVQRLDVRMLDFSPFSGVELVAGGPPCQPFSIGGKHRGSDDFRDMWPQAVRAVREARPKAFLFENVRGLVRSSFSEYLDWILSNLREPNRSSASAGDASSYEVKLLQLNAADFGAAQKRHRVIVAGIRRDLGVKLSELTPTHSRDRLLWDQWVSGDYWRRHGLAQPPDRMISKADWSNVQKLRGSNVRPSSEPWVTVRDALHGLGSPTGRHNHVFQEGARVYEPGHTGSPLDQPAKALKAGDHGVPGGENMMVRDDGSVRYFTIREAARLQGLPDDFEFPRSWSESMRQLGNAVPTQLSEAIGRWMSLHLLSGQDATTSYSIQEPKPRRAAPRKKRSNGASALERLEA